MPDEAGLSAYPTVEGMKARKGAEIDAVRLSRSATDVSICFLFIPSCSHKPSLACYRRRIGRLLLSWLARSLRGVILLPLLAIQS